MILYDMQELGGLEEYTITLAIGLQQMGHEVSILSTAWVPPGNQYLSRLRQTAVKVYQLPAAISLPASDWATKERILNGLTRLATPLLWLLGLAVMLAKRMPAGDAYRSARNWFRGRMMNGVVGPDWRKPFVRLMMNYWKAAWQPDILHIQGYTTSLLFVIDWAHGRKLPIVYEEHQTPDPQFDWWHGFEKNINKADVVVAVSEKSAEGLRTICGVTRPIVVQGPLVPDPLESGFRAWKMDDKGARIQLTATARLYVTKGLVYLLDALKLIREKHPEVSLRIYGEGPLRDELVLHANRLGLDGNEIFVGAFRSRAELSRIMEQTDIFVMPSILEGQPVSLVEAMAYGRPIVVTNVGGIPELIQDNANGLLCAPADAGCLVEKINHLIENPVVRSQMAEAARRSYEQGPFRPLSVCGNFLNVYKKVLRVS
jgi:glycosyltransferase involved in cell wall biosynthesis